MVIRVAPIIGSVIGIGRYRDISTVSVIGTSIVSLPIRIDDVIILGHVIFASKDGSKSMNLRVQHLSGKCLGTHSVQTKC